MTNVTNLKPTTIQHLLLRWIQFNYQASCELTRIIDDIKKNDYFDEDSMPMIRHLQDLMDRCGLNEHHTVHDLHMTY